ncbi:MAG TPA: hypothetical protein VJ835_02020 [Fimbriimonadaceae bacterium]|nr:hypothetical protein [Fimbriimonadaceae bacterium]
MPMIVSDLDGIQHPASIEGDSIRVKNLVFDADGFILSGLRLVTYSVEEERELVRLGILSERA